MMNRIIPAKNYYDPAIYALEQERIFGKEWLFVGLKRDIPAAKDWFTLNICGKSVIIYNSGKEIKAFHNVCPHRFNRLFTEPQGNGPLMCKYHLWAFDGEGKLAGKKDVFPQPEEKICLTSFAVELVGDFIFINLSKEQPQNLKEQLTEKLYGWLLQFTEQMQSNVYAFELPHSCNWKFIVENVMEQHHCIAVHKDTLYKTGFCGLRKPLDEDLCNKNSYFTFQCADPLVAKSRYDFLKHIFDKEVVVDRYTHILLYPNSVISLFEGVCFTLGRIIPVDEGNTIFHINLYHVKYREKAYKKLIGEFNTMSIDFAKVVYDEDKIMLDTLQTGVKQANHDGYQYTSETRLEWFTNSYFESMEGVKTDAITEEHKSH